MNGVRVSSLLFVVVETSPLHSLTLPTGVLNVIGCSRQLFFTLISALTCFQNGPNMPAHATASA